MILLGMLLLPCMYSLNQNGLASEKKITQAMLGYNYKCPNCHKVFSNDCDPADCPHCRQTCNRSVNEIKD